MATAQEAQYMASTFVDWNYPAEVEKLEKKLKKTIKKRMKVESISSNRINTFLVLTADLKQKGLEKLDQEKVEDAVKVQFKDYATKLNKRNRKSMIYNGDTHLYANVFKQFGFSFLENYQNDRQHKVIDLVEVAIEKIVSYASVAIWDFPGNTGDKLILPDRLIAMSQDAPQELTAIIDEIIILNFAKYFVPFSAQLVDQLISELTILDSLINDGHGAGEMNANVNSLLRNFVGSISGLQESIKLMKRQLLRIEDFVEEVADELSLFNSSSLNEWLEELSNTDILTTVQQLDDLNELISFLKENMRTWLSTSESSKQTSQFYQSVVEIKALSSGFVQWVHHFQDIPSFTTIDNGIAFEEVEEEEYVQSNANALIEATKLFKLYRRGNSTIYALRGVDLTINKGDFVVIRGPSGAGKTTLLNILAGLDDANRGAVFFEGEDLLSMKDSKRTRVRRDHFSFIFQSYALIPHLTAYENVKLPIDMGGLSKELYNKIQTLLDDVGIGQYSDHKPAYLSGGQMQRLGIARALIDRPTILFADEPTGDLDEKTGIQILELLKKYHEETGITIILVTHDPKVAEYATREIYLEDGKINN